MNGERIFIVLPAIAAAAALAASLEMPLLAGGLPGAGLMPAAASAFLLALSLAELASSFRRTPSPTGPTASAGGYLRSLLVIALSVLYVLLLGTTGYVPATTALVAGILMLVYRQGWFTSLSGGILLAVLSYGLFASLFRVQLPRAFFFL